MHEAFTLTDALEFQWLATGWKNGVRFPAGI